VESLDHLDGAMRPHGPLAEQSTRDASDARSSANVQRERREQIRDDVVVIPGV
jgi:hypothetical protein